MDLPASALTTDRPALILPRTRHLSVGLGNGRVFGIVGLDSPWNTLTNAVGPGYQRDGGFFGDSEVLLLDQDGASLGGAPGLLVSVTGANPRSATLARPSGPEILLSSSAARCA